MKIAINQIIPDPNQPRKTFNEKSIRELKNSFDTIGLIQPITVRLRDGKYMIIVGERRYQAALLDPLAHEIECIVRNNIDDKTTREMQFAENYHIEPLTALEQAEAWVAHIKQFGMKRIEFAKIIGVNEGTVKQNITVVTNLAPNLISAIREGKLAKSHAEVIAPIKDQKRQVEIAKPILEGKIGGYKTFEYISKAKENPTLPAEDIAVHVVYNSEQNKANGRAILDELRRQRTEERLSEALSNNHRGKILLGDMADWEKYNAFGVEQSTVDAIITDPPYPKEYLPLFTHLATFSKYVLKPNGSLFVMVGQSYLPNIISTLTKQLTYHWALAYLTPGGQSPQLWVKRVNSFWKPVLWFVNGEYQGKWIGDVVKSNVNDNDKDFHKWGQSESGMSDLINRATEPNDLIVDPFMGGGTTGKVALELGRRFVGIDVSEDVVRLARARLGVKANV